MTDPNRLAEFQKVLATMDRNGAAGLPVSRDDYAWLISEVERLQRFEAMWEDCRQHRNQAERRARYYMEIVQQVEKLVTSEEDEGP